MNFELPDGALDAVADASPPVYGVVAAAIPLLIGVVSILGTFLVLRVMATSSTPRCSR